MSRKVMVTGADGFIGSHLTQQLIREGYDVTAFCLYNSFGQWGWLDTLSKEEKANVATEFATVQQMINEYNEKTRVANSELAAATEIAFSPIVATGFTFLAALWFLLKKKFFI